MKKNQKEIKGPTKVNTHAIIGKEKKTPQKNKAPDSQTSQATCQTKEIDRAHRSHSTREAKQKKTNQNQGSPIKTMKSHDSILVPLLGRGVFTAGFAPARPFPTPTYKCENNIFVDLSYWPVVLPKSRGRVKLTLWKRALVPGMLLLILTFRVLVANPKNYR